MMGANNDPAFRIVAADERAPRQGKILENLGWYDPKKKGVNFKLNLERVEYWRLKGARITDTIQQLIKKSGKEPNKMKAALPAEGTAPEAVKKV
jgi:small subunit ribosomal protein S16